MTDMKAMNANHKPIGLIGLGLVGHALAQRLRAAGFDCIGYDLRAEGLARFAQAGHATASSVAELAASARTIVLAVFDTAGVLQITEGDDATLSLPANATGLTLIDCSTGDPEHLAALAGRLQARGIAFIEAPLSGSSAQIAAGDATLLLGGDTATIAAQTPVLDAISTRRIQVGDAGMGARAKLATNLVLGLNRAALAEGMVFAQTQGIAPATFLQLVLQTPARSGAAEAKGQMMVDGDFTPQSRIRQHLKDVGLMIEAAGSAGQKLPLSETHAALMRGAIAAGDGDLDNAAIIQQIRRTTPTLVTSCTTLPPEGANFPRGGPSGNCLKNKE
jgi:3-hydroxyisobutyrate dehydrogenase-like beta-hydroxyacid dehydrogenase